MHVNQVTDARSPGFTPGVRRPPNIKAWTSIRFFAALHVALAHLVRPYSLWGPFSAPISVGYIGVSFFFLLSGFILTYSHAAEYELGRGSPFKFWIARLARVYPVYLLSMLVAAYVSRSEFTPHYHIWAYIADLLMLQSWSIRLVNFFNVPAWSLSCEAFFYLIFPYLLLRLRPSSRSKSLLAVGGFWLLALAVPLLCVRLYPAASWTEYPDRAASEMNFVFFIRRNPVLALPQFLAGISLGWFYLRYRPRHRLATLLAVSGVVLLLVLLFHANDMPLVLLHNGLLIPIFAMIIVGVGEPNWVSRLLSNPLLVLLGEASYAFYLLHFLLNDWIKSVYGQDNTIPAAMWKLAIILPISVLVHLFVERPCRRLILRKWSERHPAELAVKTA